MRITHPPPYFSTPPSSRRRPVDRFRWPGQHPSTPFPASDGTPQNLAERLLKARRDYIRRRTAAIRGFLLSSMMAVLVGWVTMGTRPAHAPGVQEPCEDILIPAGLAAQNRLRAAIGRPSAPNSPPQKLSVRVCDPQLAALLNSPTVRSQLKNMKGLDREVAGLFGSSGQNVGLRSIWKKLLVGGSVGSRVSPIG